MMMAAKHSTHKVAVTLHRSLRKNAKARRKPVSITLEEVEEKLRRACGRCALTGLPLDMLPAVNGKRRPYGASIDRIDSSIGYTAANCRIVCTVVNYAMSDWGEEVLRRVALALCERQGWASVPAPRARPSGVIARRRKHGLAYEARFRRGSVVRHIGTFRTAEEAEIALRIHQEPTSQ